MLKGRGRDPRFAGSTPPGHPAARPASQTMSRPIQGQTHLTVRTPTLARAPLAKPEPEYEVVEFPTDQYVNAKLQPPPPPPPRPPTGHPVEASCGLCGGGGARVRCAECGRRALCASCDDMYHRHPKRRHHQRQALSTSQLRDERPPLPPKTTPPVPPPRRHKMSGDRMSASPRPASADQRRATLGHLSMGQNQTSTLPLNNHSPQHTQQLPPHLQGKLSQPSVGGHLGSMPYLPTTMQHAAAPVTHAHAQQTNTLGHVSPWTRQRASLPGFNVPPNIMNQPMPAEAWENQEAVSNHAGHGQGWCRPLRRGASVLELGGGACAGCAHCAPGPWRYGSCANLEAGWGQLWPQQVPQCCVVPHPPPHALVHGHPPHTPQPYRRADSRAVSRAASRAGSRAASPAMSVRSRASRRTKHRTPSPPPLPSSDADSESESDSDRGPQTQPQSHSNKEEEEDLGPPPAPPSVSWQCEFCTYVNEAGVRVCAICCRTPTAAPKAVEQSVTSSMARLKVQDKRSPSQSRFEEPRAKQNGESARGGKKKDRTSTGCGPSPPRDDLKKPINRLVTPTRDSGSRAEQSKTKHDAGVGPSPPRETANQKMTPERHSVSVGPSPPREDVSLRVSGTSPMSSIEKKSAGTSPPRSGDSRPSSASVRTNVSNTGTSPPPQSISTQTYEAPNSWERAPSVSRARSRARRRLRDDARRERSHSRHSLSSDTKESERSARTSRDGRWEWRERDSSPADWSDGERRRGGGLRRRASHLDLHRARPARRSSVYGSGAGSPEPLSGTRALSLEALVGAGARRDAERGLELARLMSEAERLGFSAAEVHAALAQSPAAPLAWLRERWPSLCAGVRAAAARLAPHAPITELEARAALARHRGAMWPTVTDCVERHRRQVESLAVGEEGRLRGRVWGSPAGADDDAAPPQLRDHVRARAEDSSDEFDDRGPTKFQDDDWMYLPLDTNTNDLYGKDETWNRAPADTILQSTEDVALKLKSLLMQAGVPAIDENLLLKGLLSENAIFKTHHENNSNRSQITDFIQSENDFIEAYNALTRLSPLPNVNKVSTEIKVEKVKQDVKKDSSSTTAHNEAEIYNINNATDVNDVYIKRSGNSQLKESDLHSLIPQSARQSGIEKAVLNVAAISHERIDNDEEIAIEDVLEPHVTYTAVVTQEPDENDKIKPLPSIVIASVTTSQNVVEKFQSEDIDNASKSIGLQPYDATTVINEERQRQHNVVLEANTSHSTQHNRKKSPPINHLVKQDEEKSNNLNDIVDNTQKLIQQMKEEINSDINSFEDSNISQSDADTSSNESDFSSEHESSYSETEEETDNLTSNEDEEDSSSGNEDQITEKHKIATRTSSEDNEQFEEAMDHIDDQIEDFKNTNIEILDSIARSLQEEHTVSVELNERKAIKNKDQDKNNNVFVQVNSFEEIYEQLTTSGDNAKTNNSSKNVQSTILNQFAMEKNNTEKPVSRLPKQEINISLFKPVTATKLIITEQKTQVLHAITEYTKDSKNIEVISKTNNVQDNDVDVPIFHPKVDQEAATPAENVNQQIQIVESDSESKATTDQSYHSRDVTPENTVNEAKINSSDNEVAAPNERENDAVTYSVKNNISPDKSTGTGEMQGTQTVNYNASHEKQNTYNENNINKSAPKSNIPKLIKVLSNNRAKGDKTSAKVLSSKVPIRRTSLKQYPAPAPPKSHFGNIQSGFVKQLQTRLFNDKFPKTTTAKNTTSVDVKPTTSTTLNKKKPAPQPPKPVEVKQNSPPKLSPTKEKKDHYFRETCRTEDEWTESESEDSQVRTRNTSEEKYRAPSPPPPITLRRVSGQIIDLAGVQLPEGSPERQARMLLAEGATETWEQAQLAVELVARGAEPPAALLAALECADLDAALAYLHQECELCASKYPEHEMVSMLRCVHRCCRECAHHYFTVQITERSIADCVCPYCKVPELESLPEDAWLEYFAHLDILLKTLLDTDVHELFQRKLRDRTLARDPNFRWCMECSSGFFVHPKQKKLRCPECRSVSCATCRKSWTPNHEGLSCEQYTKWLEDNDPELSITAVQQHLRENGLECPRCHFKYSLSRGGCMHFTCTQCKYEFCYGCGKPFTMGARCGLNEYCAKLGLHAHHPRNCLFYLRDKEPHELQTLLQMNNVPYETESPEGCTKRCPIQLQRETPTGLVDGTCGGDVPPNHAGLCKNHYLEYLSRLVRARGVDPLPLLGVDDLETLVRRAALRPPPRPYGSLEGLYKRGLVEVCTPADGRSRCRAHYVEYLAGRARGLDPIPIMDVPELVAELRRRALPLPERGPWDTDPIYAGMCAEIVKEKIPLD